MMLWYTVNLNACNVHRTTSGSGSGNATRSGEKKTDNNHKFELKSETKRDGLVT